MDGGSWVRINKYKGQLLIVMLAVGFFVGILYENIMLKKYDMSLQMFQSQFLKQYQQTSLVAEKYLFPVMKERLLMLAIIVILGNLKWKKLMLCGITLWTGFVLGILSVASVVQLGVLGILLCFVGMFPHMLFYIVAYSVLLSYYYHYPRIQWNYVKTIFLVLIMILGIVLEVYVNPILFKLILGVL